MRNAVRTGPPPKPTALKRLEGNPGKHRLNDREPEPMPGCVMPEWLPPGAAEYWNELTPELARLGLLTVVDQASLAVYCVAVDNFKRATNALKPTKRNPRPEIQIARSGYETPSGPELMRREAVRQIRAFAAEFGLTPASRSRVHTPGSGGDELEEALNGDTPN